MSVTNIETGDSASGGTFRFIVPEPVISNLSPNSGPEAGNTAVTISGFNFEPQTRVLFGDQAASIQSGNANQIVVRAPRFTGTFPTQPCDDNGDGTQGQRFQATSVDVRVISLGSTCEDIFQRGYTYTPADTSCRNDNAPAGEDDPQCSDGDDNDLDGQTDFPADLQCTSAADDNEAA